ncbi:MAG: hypothetical protein KC656_13485 [Myxococcales bacterium]|nr:hypothetical protein [Myxococcales bacterium]
MAMESGELVRGGPAGTEGVVAFVGEVAVLALHTDGQRYLTVAPGSFAVGMLGGETLVVGKHGYARGLEGFFIGDHAVLLGDEPDGRRGLSIYLRDRRVARLALPPRVSAMGSDGDLVLVRATQAGLERLPLAALRAGTTFRRDAEPMQVRLVRSRSHVLGLSTRGVAVWGPGDEQPSSVVIADPTMAAVSHDRLAVGTRVGAVALFSLAHLGDRAQSDLVCAFRGPVTCAAFSEDGSLLATGADSLRIWSTGYGWPPRGDHGSMAEA